MITIRNKADCCGCCACAGVCPAGCIEMQPDEEGFVYPVVDRQKCVDCHLCEKVCPVLHVEEDTPDPAYTQRAFVVQHRDAEVLRQSTSGGAFTAVAKEVTGRKGAVFGAELQEDLFALPSAVRHVPVFREENLGKFRNSKYIQSYVGPETPRRIRELLREGRQVCFSGTPCQTEGIRHFLEVSGEQERMENLLLVDVVCRAVPSPMIFRKYLEYQEKKLSDTVRSVRFRDKYYGYKYSTMQLLCDSNGGDYHEGVESDRWLRAYFSNICDRPSCHRCPFRKRYRSADLTIWDCFHVYRFSGEMDDDRGATRVLTHSEKGERALLDAASQLKICEISAEEAVAGTKEMFESIPPHPDRTAFFRDAQEMDGDALFGKYFPDTPKKRLEHLARISCLKLGIYGPARKLFVRLTGKY